MASLWLALAACSACGRVRWPRRDPWDRLLSVSSLLLSVVLERIFGQVRPDLANLRSDRTLRRSPGTCPSQRALRVGGGVRYRGQDGEQPRRGGARAAHRAPSATRACTTRATSSPGSWSVTRSPPAASTDDGCGRGRRRGCAPSSDPLSGRYIGLRPGRDWCRHSSASYFAITAGGSSRRRAGSPSWPGCTWSPALSTSDAQTDGSVALPRRSPSRLRRPDQGRVRLLHGPSGAGRGGLAPHLSLGSLQPVPRDCRAVARVPS
jgi:hypothetical protein